MLLNLLDSHPIKQKFHTAAAFGCVAIGLFVMLAPCSEAAIVLDHIHHSSGDDFSLLPSPLPSQVFTDNSEYNSMVLEDFIVSESELKITRVSGFFRALAGFNSFQMITAYQVSIFTDVGLAAGALSGNIVDLLAADSMISVLQVFAGSGSFEYGVVSIDVDVILPSSGHYWLGIAPVADSSTQFFLESAMPSASGGEDAYFANPGGGFGLTALSNSGYDAAYSVIAIPESSTILYFVALSWIVFTQRRRTGWSSK